MKKVLTILLLLLNLQLYAQIETDKEIIKKIQKVIEYDFKSKGINAEYKFIMEGLFQDEYTAFYKIKTKIGANSYTLGQGVSYHFKTRNDSPDKNPNYNYAVVDGTEKFEIGKEETTILIACPLNMVNSFVTKHSVKEMPDYTKYNTEYDFAIIVLDFANEPISKTEKFNNVTVTNFTLVNKQKRTGYEMYVMGQIKKKEDTEIDEDVMNYLP